MRDEKCGHQTCLCNFLVQSKRPMAIEIELDLSDHLLQECVAGIRPYRVGSYRIESELIGKKNVIHNYGHGGCGVTLSWGSAQEVLRLANADDGTLKTVGVLGAGVNGLTTAILMAEQGFSVTIYTAETSPNTTSDIAGAQWAPSFICFGDSEKETERFHENLRESYRVFESLIGDEYGVSRRTNYVEDGHSSFFDRLPKGILPPPKHYSRLPFSKTNVSGRSFETLLIETPRYMGRLMQRVKSNGIEIKLKTFTIAEEISLLPEETIVNCLGAGAAEVMQDKQMEPIKGQLAMLPPTEEADWLLSHKTGYIFPRKDALVVGGTVERGISDASVSREACVGILMENRKLLVR